MAGPATQSRSRLPRIARTFDGYADYMHDLFETVDGQLTTKTVKTMTTEMVINDGRGREASGTRTSVMKSVTMPIMVIAGGAAQPPDETDKNLATKTEALVATHRPRTSLGHFPTRRQ